jgi:CBS-domain-containing membrane protein
MNDIDTQLIRLLKLVGAERPPASHTEKLVSAAGAFAGILSVYLVSQHFLGNSSVFLVASMGASAVLLFAVPHGALSQPWSLLGGHVVSALVGATCARFVPEALLAAPLAVGLAVGSMYYLRCIHPPGGATALVAVIGGADVHTLGYAFVAAPVLLNALVMLVIAVAFNALFRWRMYPAYLHRLRAPEPTTQSRDRLAGVEQEDLVYALSEIDSFVDVTGNDLQRIYELATQHHAGRGIGTENLQAGHYYSNGRYGDEWAVRLIIELDERDQDPARKLIYKHVAGLGRRTTAVTTRGEFTRWARHEVYRDEENWRRVAGSGETRA